jgi:hypothetical protein
MQRPTPWISISLLKAQRHSRHFQMPNLSCYRSVGGLPRMAKMNSADSGNNISRDSIAGASTWDVLNGELLALDRHRKLRQLVHADLQSPGISLVNIHPNNSRVAEDGQPPHDKMRNPTQDHTRTPPNPRCNSHTRLVTKNDFYDGQSNGVKAQCTRHVRMQRCAKHTPSPRTRC